MNVELLHYSSLEIIVKAIRKCYASEGKSDSGWELETLHTASFDLGPKDKALIQNIIKNDHTSTLEHLNFTFDIDGISRAALQELARHRHASLSVKSTRYTWQELGDTAIPLGNFLVKTGCKAVEDNNLQQLQELRDWILSGAVFESDRLKYMLPEAFKTSLIWTINARSLRNFLKLRSSKRALWEMQELAKKVFEVIPADMKFMFEDCVDSSD